MAAIIHTAIICNVFFLSDVVILTKLYEVEVRKFKVLH